VSISISAVYKHTTPYVCFIVAFDSSSAVCTVLYQTIVNIELIVFWFAH